VRGIWRLARDPGFITPPPEAGSVRLGLRIPLRTLFDCMTHRFGPDARVQSTCADHA
jgi:hypothetical protein